MLQNFLDDFGFKYNFKSATELYKNGFFNEQLKNVLNNYEVIYQKRYLDNLLRTWDLEDPSLVYAKGSFDKVVNSLNISELLKRVVSGSPIKTFAPC